MRPLELVLTAALAARVLAALLPGRAGAVVRSLLALLAGVAMVLQLVFEGPRWQLLALDALTAWFLVRALAVAPGRGRRRGWLRLVGTAIAFGLALAPALLVPLPRLPAPTGPFAIGTFSFELSDANRSEIFGERAGAPRTVVVRVWYPIDDPAGALAAPWTESLERLLPSMAAYGGLPAWMLGHLTLVRSHAAWGAPLSGAQERYPTLFFEHGRAGWRSQSSFLTEDLASHGYVVVAVEHPYGALLTVFADGSEARLLAGVLPSGGSADEISSAQRALQQWVADVRLVATGLRIGVLPPLAGRLDLDRVGVVGHSTGGASALELCASWSPCQAAVALDPWLVPLSDEALLAGSDAPTLLLTSDPELEVFGPANTARIARVVAGLRGESSLLLLAGAGHHDFDDTGTFSPFARLLGYSKGPIPIGRAFAAIRDTTRGFFDRQLLGLEASAPERRHPAVRIAPLAVTE